MPEGGIAWSGGGAARQRRGCRYRRPSPRGAVLARGWRLALRSALDGESWARRSRVNPRSGGTRREQGHVEVDAVSPDRDRLQGDGGDESQGTGAVGERADGAGAAL